MTSPRSDHNVKRWPKRLANPNPEGSIHTGEHGTPAGRAHCRHLPGVSKETQKDGALLRGDRELQIGESRRFLEQPVSPR